MAFATCFILLLGCAVATHPIHLTGIFGDHVFSLDVLFGHDFMEATISRPLNAPDSFRETTNIHIFSKHMAVKRNSMEKECYVHYFSETSDLLKGRVQNADYNNGMLGNVRVEALYLDGVPPISPRTVRILLGQRVFDACQDHDVFLLEPKDYVSLAPGELLLTKYGRVIVVAGTCRRDW